jgi:hypothetical protein
MARGRKPGKDYIDPIEFNNDLIDSLQNKDSDGVPHLTSAALHKLDLMISKLINRKMRYDNAMDRDDVVQTIWLDILKTWHRYDPNIGSTPFSFFTSYILLGAAKFWKQMYGDKKELGIVSISGAHNTDNNEIYNI